MSGEPTAEAPADPAPPGSRVPVVPLVFATVVAVGLGLGGRRVVDLAHGEVDDVGEWTVLEGTKLLDDDEIAPHRELGRVAVQPGESLMVELCVDGALDPSAWGPSQVALVLWQPERHEVAHRVAVDEATLARARRGARPPVCFEVARGRGIARGGTYALEAVWGEGSSPPPEPVRARMVVHRGTPGPGGWLAWSSILVGILGLLGSFPRGATGPTPRASGGLPVGLLGVGALLVAIGLVPWLPLPGPLGTLGRGVTLGGVSLAIALTLGRAGVLDALRQPAPRATLLAPLVGVALWVGSRLAAAAIPATGQAPIEAMVAKPSGLLAVALVSVLVPAAEEVFFRGFLFASVTRRLGDGTAVVVTTLVFAVAHLPQTHGAWGGLLAVTAVGAGLGVLRAWSGALAPCVVAHLVHNALLSGAGLLAGR